MQNKTVKTDVRQHSQLNWWARIKATNFLQAAFVRPFEDKKNWTKQMATLLSYAFGLLFVVTSISMLIDDALSWPMPIEQMQKISGNLSNVVISRRGPSYLVVTTSSGNDERFFARSLQRIDLSNQIGHHVTVWSQAGFELFYGRIKEARELRLDDSGRYVLMYMKNLPWLIQKDEKDQYWFLAMLALGLFLITRPVWKHRKPIHETPQTTKRGE